MNFKLLFLLVFVFVTAKAQQLNSPQKILNQSKKCFFIQNNGQWNPEVKYLASIGGLNAWITNSGVVYDYYKIKKNFDEKQTLNMNTDDKLNLENHNYSIQGDVLKMQIVNASMNKKIIGTNKKEGLYNYFIGNDKNKWIRNVPLYDNIVIKDVYEKIDVKYYFDKGILRYDYIVKTGADLSMIKFKFEGQKELNVNTDGELELSTSLGDVKNGKIYAYQMEVEGQKKVECKFELIQDGNVGFIVTGYDKLKELIIDPLVYSTFIGGSNQENAFSMAIDVSGNTYITGSTNSTDFPETTGSYKTGNRDNYNAFIIKLNSSGTGLIYSSFFGGGGNDHAKSIVIDDSLNAFITGETGGPGFPTTDGAYQTVWKNYSDIFITKLNPEGNDLIFSTLIPGSGHDSGNSIAIDGNKNVYITGETDSQDFITTVGAHSRNLGTIGNVNAFMTKLNYFGTDVVYSTYFGKDPYVDIGFSIALDSSGNVYITGQTLDNAIDAFVAKINPAIIGDKSLVYFTPIGGSGTDVGHSIVLDVNKNVYITGYTNSTNFPISAGAYQLTNKGSYDAFITKLDSNGSGTVVYSTYIGGSGDDNGQSIVIDSSDNAYITGFTNSTDFPTASNFYQGTNKGSNDIFFTKLKLFSLDLVYSTYIGGNDDDYGRSVVIDKNGNVYLTGYTNSSDYHTTNSAYQTMNKGSYDAFLTKLYFSTISTPTLTFPTNNSTGVSLSPSLSWSSITGADKYRLEVNTKSDFTGTVIYDNNTVSSTSIQIGGLTDNMKYYWKVTAFNNAGDSSEVSNTFNFTTSQTVLTSASDGATAVSTSPILSWNKTTGASKYRLEVNTRADFWATPIFDNATLTDTSQQISGLINNTIYYWRVTASSNVISKVKTSGVYSFRTKLSTPALALPTNNSIDIIHSPTLSWTGVSGADKYRLEVNTNPDFTGTIIYDKDTVSQTSRQIGVLNGSVKYYWRVTALNIYGNSSNPSSTFNFTTIAPTNTNGLVAYYPFNSNSNDSSGNGYNGINNGATSFTDRFGNTNSAFYFDGSSYVRVTNNSGFDFGNSDYSISVWAMRSGNNSIQEIICKELGSPSYTGWYLRFQNNIIVFNSGTTYDGAWHTNGEVQSNTISNSVWYHIVGVFNPSNNTVKLYVNNALVDSISTPNQLINSNNNTDLMFGVYFPNGASSGTEFLTGSFDDIRIFNRALSLVEINALYHERGYPQLSTPILTTPSNNSTDMNLTPTLSWSTVVGVNQYRLEVNTNSDFNGTVIYDNNTVSSTSIQIGGLTDNTKYYWRVTAIDNSGNSSDASSTFNFTTSRTILTSASNGATAVSTSPTLSWNKTTGASKYSLEINTKYDFTGNTVFYNNTLTDTLQEINGLHYNTTYYWKVTARSNVISKVKTSNVYSFTTKLATPTLNTPSNNSTDVTLTPTLTWATVSGADKYRLEVNTNSVFTGTVVYDNNAITSNSKQISGLTEKTKYYWRVIALNNVGNSSDTSSTFNFTTQTATGIDDLKNIIPEEYSLSQNYPNPFNPSTVIRYGLPSESFVTIKIYNLLGQELEILTFKTESAGYHEVSFNANKLASGIYFYRISATSTDGKDVFIDTKKLVLIK